MSRSYSHPLSLSTLSITHIHNEYKNKLISFLFPIVHNKRCVLCRWNVDSSPSKAENRFCTFNHSWKMMPRNLMGLNTEVR